MNLWGGLKFVMGLTILVVVLVAFTPLPDLVTVLLRSDEPSEGRTGDGPPLSEETIDPALAIAGPEPTAVEKLREGMTYEEVEALLGVAGRKKGTLTMPSGDERDYFDWSPETGSLTTTFSGGKLLDWSIAR